MSDWWQDLFIHSNTLCYCCCWKLSDHHHHQHHRHHHHDALHWFPWISLHESKFFTWRNAAPPPPPPHLWALDALLWGPNLINKRLCLWTNSSSSSNCVAFLFMIGKLMTHDDVFLSLQAPPLQSWWWFWSELRPHLLRGTPS